MLTYVLSQGPATSASSDKGEPFQGRVVLTPYHSGRDRVLRGPLLGLDALLTLDCEVGFSPEEGFNVSPIVGVRLLVCDLTAR